MTDLPARPFRNTLAKGDRVLDVTTGRFGTVARQPRPLATSTAIVIDGNSTPIYHHLSILRFVVDGRPEDVPPHEGELDPRDVGRVKTPNHPDVSTDEDAVAKLFDEKRRLLLELITVEETILRLQIARRRAER